MTLYLVRCQRTPFATRTRSKRSSPNPLNTVMRSRYGTSVPRRYPKYVASTSASMTSPSRGFAGLLAIPSISSPPARKVAEEPAATSC
jgi:hypothetical protein